MARHELINALKLRRVARIRDEHRIFATFAKASTPPDQSNTVVSSLVVGERFIHSYHVRYRLGCKTDGAIFLILITYSTYDNTSFLRTWTCIHEIVCTTQGYLTVSC